MRKTGAVSVTCFLLFINPCTKQLWLQGNELPPLIQVVEVDCFYLYDS